jgi:phosphatidate phosphatase PAH1
MARRVHEERPMRCACLLVIATACTTTSGEIPQFPPTTSVASDIRCTSAPSVGPAGEFRHAKNDIVSNLGEPHHRGIDLIATLDAPVQTLAGVIAYGDADKALEDEDVELFACDGTGWQSIGTARTDGDGSFSLALSGSARLAAGMRDMYLSVVGDRSGAAFLALVAPPATPVFISDVDGTLTASENEFPESLVTGDVVAPQAHAPAAFMVAATKGITPVYITARGTQYTDETRRWLADNGFPRGPVQLAADFATLPGSETIEFKTGAMQTMTGFTLVAGVGNRASDITAYTNAGIAADRIFIKLPEFTSEVATPISGHQAVGIADYADLHL